jgi:hypothetical protein
MSAVTGNIDTFIKSYGITGNAYIDTIIIANLLPILIAYINGVLSFMKIIGSQIFELIYQFLSSTIKAKFVGQVICSITVEQNNVMFDIIKDNVFDQKVVSDVDENMVRKLFTLVNDKDIISYYHTPMTFNSYHMHLDYSGDKMFNFNSRFESNNIKRKAFKHKNYYIRCSLTEQQQSIDLSKDKGMTRDSEITIELISFEKISKDTRGINYVGEIEEFLKGTFGIAESMTYLYKVTIGDSYLKERFSNFLQSAYVSSNTGLLTYGDGKFKGKNLKTQDNSNNYVSNNITVKLKCRNINDNTENLIDNILVNKDKQEFNDGQTDFHSLYRTFVSKKGIDPAHYGYYMDDNILHLIFKYNSVYYLYLVSSGKLLMENDIKNKISFILKNGNEKKKSSEAVIKKGVSIYKFIDKQWQNYKLDIRNFDTIYLPKSQISEIRKEIDNFKRIEPLYKECNIPYRKGILFYGPPGTGKTSLVKALAYEYQMNIYIFNVNDDYVNDDTIIDMLNSIGNGGNKILLFEDIDTAFADKEKVLHEGKTSNDIFELDDHYDESNKTDAGATVTVTKGKKYLTYSGLLNALDGTLSNHHGVITIMTTNYINKLGDAFLRPGRIDRKFELAECNGEQINMMAKNIITKSIKLSNEFKVYGESYIQEYFDDNVKDKLDLFVKNLIDENDMSKIKPCQLQVYLLRYIENIDNIFNNYQELLKA